MRKDEFFQILEDVDPELVVQAGTYGRPVWPKVLVAACLVAVLGIGFLLPGMRMGDSDPFHLERSSGVTVTVLEEQPPENSTSIADLQWLTEEALLNMPDTDIFRGTVTQVRNLQISYNGTLVWDAVATVSVEQVFRGEIKPGDTVTIRLGCPIKGGIWMEDSETVSAMEAGVTGIFIPVKYDEHAYREENGARLYLQELADYGFGDGVRFAFLEKDGKLIYAHWAYPSMGSAVTLEEVEEYVVRMVQQSEPAQTGTITLYSQPDNALTKPAEQTTVQLPANQEQTLRELLESAECCKDDHMINRDEFGYDGEFRLPESDTVYYFSLGDRIIWFDSYHTELTDAQVQTIRELIMQMFQEFMAE